MDYFEKAAKAVFDEQQYRERLRKRRRTLARYLLFGSLALLLVSAFLANHG